MVLLNLHLKSKPKNDLRWLHKANEQSVVFSISDKDIRNQFYALGLSQEELRIAKTIQPLIKEKALEIASYYYDAMCKIPEFKAINGSYSARDRWIQVHGNFFVKMFDCHFDDAHIERLRQIAFNHHKIGVLQQWYIASFQILQEKSLECIYDSTANLKEFYQIAVAVSKILNFQQQVILEALEKVNHQKEQEAFQKVKEELKEKIFETGESLVAVTEETSASVEELIQKSKKLSDQGQQTAEKTKTSQQLAKEGQKQLSSLDEQIQAIYHSTLVMKKTVEALNDLSSQIIDVAVIVEGISSQTNLLSLNASIEAARAGEYGKGFAVVANEVRKLSEQTRESVKSIKELTEQITAQKDKVISSLHEVEHLTEVGKEKSAMTSEAFDRIVKSADENLETVEQTKSDIQNLVEIITEIGKATQTIVQSTEKLNDAARLA